MSSVWRAAMATLFDSTDLNVGLRRGSLLTHRIGTIETAALYLCLHPRSIGSVCKLHSVLSFTDFHFRTEVLLSRLWPMFVSWACLGAVLVDTCQRWVCGLLSIVGTVPDLPSLQFLAATYRSTLRTAIMYVSSSGSMCDITTLRLTEPASRTLCLTHTCPCEYQRTFTNSPLKFISDHDHLPHSSLILISCSNEHRDGATPNFVITLGPANDMTTWGGETVNVIFIPEPCEIELRVFKSILVLRGKLYE